MTNMHVWRIRNSIGSVYDSIYLATDDPQQALMAASIKQGLAATALKSLGWSAEMAGTVDFEFYLLQSTQKLEHANNQYWILLADVVDPGTPGDLVVISRDHGTLIHNDEEYTIMEIDGVHATLADPDRRFVQIKTPIKPDTCRRFLPAEAK